MAEMNKTHTLSFRLAEDDYQTLARRCREADLTQSKYLRYLIRTPLVLGDDHGEDVRCVILDKVSLRKISRELTRWGYHYNQAVHAMNSINYYLVHGKAKENLLDGKAESIEIALMDVNKNAQRIAYAVGELQSAHLLKE